jgi:hypothetical protein
MQVPNQKELTLRIWEKVVEADFSKEELEHLVSSYIMELLTYYGLSLNEAVGLEVSDKHIAELKERFEVNKEIIKRTYK